jgi:hypothetical protein
MFDLLTRRYGDTACFPQHCGCTQQPGVARVVPELLRHPETLAVQCQGTQIIALCLGCLRQPLVHPGVEPSVPDPLGQRRALLGRCPRQRVVALLVGQGDDITPHHRQHPAIADRAKERVALGQPRLHVGGVVLRQCDHCLAAQREGQPAARAHLAK